MFQHRLTAGAAVHFFFLHEKVDDRIEIRGTQAGQGGVPFLDYFQYATPE